MGKYAKFIVAAIAAAGVVASSGLLPEHVAVWVNVAIAAVSAALVYLVPNAEVPPPRR